MKLSKYEPRIEIHHDLIVKNLKAINVVLKKEVKIMAVVKSDAYGHGLPEVVKTLEPYVDMYGVGYLNEAFDCGNFTKKDIFIMGPVYDFDLVNRQQFILTIENVIQFQSLIAFIKMEREESAKTHELKNKDMDSDPETKKQLSEKGFRVHFKVDTGMSRFGLSKEELITCLDYINNNHFDRWISVEGMFSHFSNTVRHGNKHVDQQYRVFNEFKKTMETKFDRSKLLFHIANSENAIDNIQYQEDMVRLGNGLYGPLALKNPMELSKVAKVLLPILSIHEKEKSTFIGYGAKKRLKKGSKIGIIQVGFYDGFGLIKNPIGQSMQFVIYDCIKRLLKTIFKPEKVYLGGETFPIIGTVNMQFFQIDITKSHLMIGDFVEIKQAPLYFKGSVKRLHIMEDSNAINS